MAEPQRIPLALGQLPAVRLGVGAAGGVRADDAHVEDAPALCARARVDDAQRRLSDPAGGVPRSRARCSHSGGNGLLPRTSDRRLVRLSDETPRLPRIRVDRHESQLSGVVPVTIRQAQLRLNDPRRVARGDGGEQRAGLGPLAAVVAASGAHRGQKAFGLLRGRRRPADRLGKCRPPQRDTLGVAVYVAAAVTPPRLPAVRNLRRRTRLSRRRLARMHLGEARQWYVRVKIFLFALGRKAKAKIEH